MIRHVDPAQHADLGLVFREAEAGDEILIGGGTYACFDGVIDKDLVVRGSGDVIIEGFGERPTLSMLGRDATVRLEGLTFLNGDASHGGALSIEVAGTTHLVRCTLGANRAQERGGAVNMAGGVLHVDRCRFVGNAADEGGAIAALEQAHLVVRDTTFEDNQAARGSAVWVGAGSTALVQRCTVSGPDRLVFLQGGAQNPAELYLVESRLSGMRPVVVAPDMPYRVAVCRAELPVGALDGLVVEEWAIAPPG